MISLEFVIFLYIVSGFRISLTFLKTCVPIC